MRRAPGFSLLELTVAMALMMVVTGSVFGLMHPAQGTFAVEPEVADMQQRLRVATDTLSKDLVMAGAGSYAGAQAGSLGYYFASVLPFRQGAIGAALPGTFTTDTISLIYVPQTKAQSTLSLALAPNSQTMSVNAEPQCPQNQSLCGFKAGMTVLIYDDTGNYDTFSVTGVTNLTVNVVLNKPAGASQVTYKVGSKVVEGAVHTYYLKTDAATQTYQLMHYDGTTNADVPLIDHVVGLSFEYYGESQPPALRKPVSDPTGPWTTYGPKPPALGVQATAYPAGENCTFLVDALTGAQAPRLAPLGPSGNALVKLTQAQLTDGPWCPDVNNTNRWDADLLRIRKIGVTVRVQATMATLRGPAGTLFTNGGTSRGNRYAPDQEIRFQVSPRNLNLGR